MDQEVLDARSKLQAKFANTQIGGKGIYWRVKFVGTQRRKKKHVNEKAVGEDKKIKSAIKKFGNFQILTMQECNHFRILMK